MNLLFLIFVLNLFIILAESNMSQKQAIINATNAKLDLKNSERGQSNLATKGSSNKISVVNELVTNRRIKIKGTVNDEISQVVVFSSNNADLYRTNTEDGSYKVELSFATPGTKEVHIVGLNEDKEVIDQLTKKVNVYQVEKHLIHDMPYFYQYHNDYFPASTCQNTAIAMLLKYYGWQGDPDQITKKFGKMKAQYGGGFSEVFNHYASNSDLNVRIRNNVNVSPQYIEEQLKKGKPVIAHGKFTSYGHIIVLVGFDDQYYYANDPAGKWDQKYRGDYGARTPQNGKYVRYKKDNLLRAMERSVGLWIHELYLAENN